MRLRNKFILHFAVLVVITMTAVMAVVVSRQTAVLKDQARKRGLAIAQNVAASSSNSLLVYQMIDLEQDVGEIANLEDIVFVAIFDNEGRQWAFSSNFGMTGDAIQPPTGSAAGTPNCFETNERDLGHILNIACPVYYVSETETRKRIGSVRLGLSLESIDAEIGLVRGRFAFLWAASLALGIFSSSLLAERITRPIERVAAGAERYAKGELDHRIEIVAKDEIAGLAGTMNDMAEQIHENLAEIEQLNRGLEAKVRKRTKDLARANQDLTQTLAKLKDTQSQLIQSEKMASLGQLMAGVAHEINNPLNFIANGVAPLRESVDEMKELLTIYDRIASINAEDRRQVDDFKEEMEFNETMDGVEDLIETIQEGTRRASVIVQDLRNFSRLDEAESKTADIHEGIEGTLNLLRPRLSGRVRVEKNYGKVPEFEFRPAQMNQVFMNLLSNAEQAIVGKGTITIRTGIEDDFAVVRITDTGKGIPEEHMNRLFEPFFTTKEVGQGTGLGLSIGFGIVEKHGGSIEVQSEVGVGSTFVVKIPRTGGSPESVGLQDNLQR